jgi:hypothetical protein
MAVPISASFDYLKEQIDINEHAARDIFRFNVDNWARFRWTIAVGNESSHLSGTSIPEEVKGAYRELGKCHHEAISLLAYCGLSLQPLLFGNPFVIQKTIKDFYFHGGSMLDNLSRVIYIVNVPDAASARTKANGTGDYKRHAMTRGRLLENHKAHIGPYIQYLDSPLIQEFSAVRNTIAHFWMIPIRNGEWPRPHLKDKGLAWHYDEAEYHKYTGWQPVEMIIHEHLKELERVQNEIFGLLVTDIATFETNNKVQIV